ncbi:MAG: transposase [Gammaproteobacteria bacterium RIFOXYA12_FULL_61_12]|nr:MAG: transposase [Gammaproteobacteria bacterium RIFOXYA12_FULL_61_12]
MKRTKLLQEIRKMRFEEAYGGWCEGRLSQEEAASLLGVCARSFRRYVERYEEEGLQGLIDKRLEQVSHRRAPVDEVVRLVERYRQRHGGWNVKHFHAWYRRDGGTRSYSWVKSRLQEAGVVTKAPGRGQHRKRRERAAWAGMMLHQDASTHEWVPGVKWDLVVTMDDATNEHYSMRFVEQEGTASRFLGVRDVIEQRGLFASLYTDRGSHYWHTPEAGGKVDKGNLTQFGKAMARLGIEMIPAYSPEARGRSERMFRTHQGRLPQELALAGITRMEEANRYLEEVYRPAFNTEFLQPAMEEGSAFVPWISGDLDDYLCETHERVVGKDNCVSFEGLALQIPQDRHRMHYMKVKVRVHRYPDRRLALFHGPRCLAHYDAEGRPVSPQLSTAA